MLDWILVFHNLDTAAAAGPDACTRWIALGKKKKAFLTGRVRHSYKQ